MKIERLIKPKFAGNVYLCARCCSSAIGGDIKKAVGAAENHIFGSLPYTNLRELSEYLRKDIIFNDGALIMLNKPAGLKKEKPRTERKPVEIRMTPSNEKNDHLTFSDVLPYLSRDLNLSNLQLIKVPERYASGVSILCTDEIMKNRIRKALGDVSQPVFTYLAVCVGIPLTSKAKVKLGITLLEKNGIKRAIFVQNYSKRSVKQDKVMPLVMNHDTVCVNEKLKVSLVRIANNRNKWSGLRAYCAQRLLSPILGDSMHASCVQVLNQKAMAVSPFSAVANFSSSKLAANILSTLQLAKHEQSIIPLHLHLAQVNFAKFKKGGTAFIAKPPDYFLWTCEKFGLAIPELYLQNGVAPASSAAVDQHSDAESV